MSPQAQTATASIPEVEKESSMSLSGMGTRAIFFYPIYNIELYVGVSRPLCIYFAFFWNFKVKC